MRKAFVILLALILALGSCSIPDDGIDGADGTPGTPGANGEPGTDGAPGKDATAEKPNVHVVNSAWDIVYETRVEGRAVQSTDYIDLMVSTYNGAHTDDQWRIIYGDVPEKETAPAADAYIIDSALAKLVEVHGITRAGLPDKRESLRTLAEDKKGTLYIDKTPPEPALPPPVLTDHEKYAIYLVAASGAVIAEAHCASDPWAANGYASLDEWFRARKEMFELQARADGKGEYVISGRLYP